MCLFGPDAFKLLKYYKDPITSKKNKQFVLRHFVLTEVVDKDIFLPLLY